MKIGSHGELFIGWSKQMPKPDRRAMLGAALSLGIGGGALAAGLAKLQDAPGGGEWNQADVRDWSGFLVRSPYPMLRLISADGAEQTALLGSSGKVGLQDRLPKSLDGFVTLKASPITRGDNLMLAAVDADDWIRLAASDQSPPPLIEKDLGPVLLTGEILDAKCWFGAMSPGFGKTHKACAALCVHGGLPLTFCAGSDCRTNAKAPLFLNENGAPHGPSILPYAADPVAVEGRLVQVGGLLELRAPISAIRRL
jgi:hypothetical protein